MPATTGHPAAEPSPDSGPSYGKGTGVGMGGLALACAAVLAGGFAYVQHQRAEAHAELETATMASASVATPVDVIAAVRSPALQRLVLPGETAAWYDSRIYARVNGYVSKWYVDIGDHVKSGQVLASIETPETDAALLASRAKLQASMAEVQVKQANADFARSTDERWQSSPQGVVSQQERESKKAAYVGANAELAAAKAQVALDQADVDRLTALTEFKQVKAPFDGTIVQRDIDIGNLVTAGSTSSTSSLYRISLDDPMRVFVNVPQIAAERLLGDGAQAVVTNNGAAARHYEGKVARTSKAINPQARTLRVEIDIPNSDAGLIPGMYVQVEFKLKAGGGVEVPAAALLFRPGPQVAVVDPSGSIDFHPVQIGADNGSDVELVSGLKEGERVALNLSSQVVPGEKVDAREVDQTGGVKAAGK